MRDDAALQRRTMIVLAITQVVGTVGVGIAPSIGVLLAGEVTQNEAWAGLARTASTLGAALIGLPLGSLAARRGRRVALASGWWLAAFGAALLVASAQWSEPITLFAGLLAIGAGSAASLQSRFAATDLADPRHRGRSLALIVWVGTIGSVLGPNLGCDRIRCCAGRRPERRLQAAGPVGRVSGPCSRRSAATHQPAWPSSRS
jgi:MFS family permease